MKKAIQFLRQNPEITFFICAFILWTAFMCNENAREGGDFSWHDIKVEANGMIFDLFVFGILVTTYNAMMARKEKIERLKEEIDDYRKWNEKEAMYKIVGIVKRLNKLGITKINLSDCFLQNADLEGIQLHGANLCNANLQWANLIEADLSHTLLSGANFKHATLFGADFQNAFIDDANFQNATLLGINMNSKRYRKAFKEPSSFETHPGASKFQGTHSGILQLVNLECAFVVKNWYELLEEWNVGGRDVIMKKYSIIEFEKSFAILKEKPNLPTSLISLLEPA